MWKSHVKIICFIPLVVLAFILHDFLLLFSVSILSLISVKIFGKEISKVTKSLLKFLIPTIPLMLILWTLFSSFENGIVATIRFSSLTVVLFSMMSCFEVQETFKLLSEIFPYKFSYIIVLCIRYMEVIKDDMSRINLIRKARGFEEKGSLKKKIKSKSELIVPVFVDSLLKAEDITCALESRCFGLYRKRTFWR